MKRWTFSMLLGASYLLLFHLWMIVSRSWVIASGVTATLALLALFALAARHQYFINRWDALLHLVVILDIFFEALFIPEHQARGFYLCALGFAAVIGGYRLYLRKQHHTRL